MDSSFEPRPEVKRVSAFDFLASLWRSFWHCSVDGS